MSNVPIIALDGKLAGETILYGIDFAGDLGEASITAETVTAATGAVGTVTRSGSVVLAPISGGEGGTVILALFQADTSDGQRLQCYALIPVIAPPA